MNGGAGDDTLVWNNGDGTDVVNGDDGRDDVEVNGAPAAGDVFTVQPNGARIKFDRTNLVPFSLDIGSSETLHANGLGGDDAITVGEVGSYAVTASGGPGNDTLTGGGSSETFLGGSGNDTITPGGGLDVVSGDEGDDQVNVRDNTADVARGGDGNDSVVADTADLDILDGFETVDRTPVVTPPPVDTSTRPVTIRGGTVKVSKGTASIKVSCPATSPGNCTGSLAVRTAKGVKLAGLKVVLQLGSARYNLAPGASRTLKVKLAKGSKRLADRKGHLKVLAVASTGPSGKIAQSSRRLTLALGTATKRGSRHLPRRCQCGPRRTEPGPASSRRPDPGDPLNERNNHDSQQIHQLPRHRGGDSPHRPGARQLWRRHKRRDCVSGPAEDRERAARDGRCRERRLPGRDPRRLEGSHCLPVREGHRPQEHLLRCVRHGVAARHDEWQAERRLRRDRVDARHDDALRRQDAGDLQRPSPLPLRG